MPWIRNLQTLPTQLLTAYAISNRNRFGYWLLPSMALYVAQGEKYIISCESEDDRGIHGTRNSCRDLLVSNSNLYQPLPEWQLNCTMIHLHPFTNNSSTGGGGSKVCLFEAELRSSLLSVQMSAILSVCQLVSCQGRDCMAREVKLLRSNFYASNLSNFQIPSPRFPAIRL